MNYLPILRTHDITLCRDMADGRKLTLAPLADVHLPLLYRWNSDPEVLYWCDDEAVARYSPEDVRGIYGPISRQSHCFLMLIDLTPVGECWLQRMNVANVSALYPKQDVRRIDLTIGEKQYWGGGIGGAVVGLLTQFAFESQKCDVLHCFVADYNRRSQRTFAKNGFELTKIEPIPNNAKTKAGFHFVLRRERWRELGCHGKL